MSDGVYDFRVLGSLEVLAADGSSVDLGGPRQRAVLAALLTTPGEVVPTDALVEAVWPGELPANPRRAIQSYVARLRQRLGSDVVVARGDGYAVITDGGNVDAQRFAEAQTGEGDPAQVLAGWRGLPFQELADWPPAQARGARLLHTRAALAARCVEQDLADGRFVEAASRGRESVVEYPYDERLWSGLMRALYHCGQQAEAVAACVTLRDRLRDDLGLDLSPELIELERAILRHVALPAPRPPAVAGRPRLPALLQRFAERSFVGRQDELSSCFAAWEEATGRVGTRLVLLTGEPGIGKTHLAAELAGRVSADGGLVLFGGARPDPGVAPGPLVDVIRGYTATGGAGEDGRSLVLSARERGVLARVAPEFGDPAPLVGDVDADRSELAAVIARALSQIAQAVPVLVVLDDLHWAGRSTFGVVGEILRSAPEARLLVVATMRDVPPDTSPELDDLLGDLLRLPMTSRIRLPGLDVEAVAELLPRGDDESVRELVRRSAGVPLLVTQLASSLPGQSLPGQRGHTDDVRDSVMSRVGRLGDEVTEVLRTAAVVGEQFSIAVLLGCVSDVPTLVASLSTAEAARLIEPVDRRGEEMRFHHAVVRDALYDSLAVLDRFQRHVAVAGALTRSSGDESGPHSAQVAWHLSRGGPMADVAACVRHARATAARASASALNAEAADLLALPLGMDGLTEHERCRLLVEKATADGLAGQDVASAVSAREANQLAAANGWDDLLVAAALAYAPTSGRWLGDSAAEGGRIVAVALATAAGNDVQRARLALRDLCFKPHRQPRSVRCSVADEALREIRANGSGDDLLLGLIDAKWGLQSVVQPPFHLYRELAGLAEAQSSPRLQWWRYMAEFTDAWYRHDGSAFCADQTEWLSLSDALGPAERYWAAASASAAALIGGDTASALALSDRAFDHVDGQMVQTAFRNASSIYMLAAVFEGDAGLPELFAKKHPERIPVGWGLQLLADQLQVCRFPAPFPGFSWSRLLPLSDPELPAGALTAAVASLGAVADGEMSLVETIYRRLEPVANRLCGTPWVPVPAGAFVLGRLALNLGWFDLAADHFQMAARVHDDFGAPAFTAL